MLAIAKRLIRGVAAAAQGDHGPARKAELPEEKAYKAPLTDGTDRRVSRQDVAEEAESQN